MASLGSFSAAAREYDPDPTDQDTVDFCGEEFTVVGDVPPMILLTMAATLAGKVGGIDGSAAIYQALEIAFTVPEHEADGKTVYADDTQWDRFRELAINNGVPHETLSAIAFNITGAQVGRPTKQRSGSSSGPLPTSTSSSSSVSDSPDSPTSNSDAAASAG